MGIFETDSGENEIAGARDRLDQQRALSMVGGGVALQGVQEVDSSQQDQPAVSAEVAISAKQRVEDALARAKQLPRE